MAMNRKLKFEYLRQNEDKKGEGKLKNIFDTLGKKNQTHIKEIHIYPVKLWAVSNISLE